MDRMQPLNRLDFNNHLSFNQQIREIFTDRFSLIINEQGRFERGPVILAP